MARYRITSLKRVRDDRGLSDDEVVFEVAPSWLGRLLGMKVHEVVYHGSGTVWHKFPSGGRASTPMEMFISDMVQSYRI